MSDQVHTGQVVWFNGTTGIGFIKPDNGGNDLFVHYSNINMEGFKTLKAEQHVSYKLGTNHKGEQAVDVLILEKQGA